MTLPVTKATSYAADTASAIAVTGGILHYLPTAVSVIGGVLAIVWYAMQIYQGVKRKRQDH